MSVASHRDSPRVSSGRHHHLESFGLIRGQAAVETVIKDARPYRVRPFLAFFIIDPVPLVELLAIDRVFSPVDQTSEGLRDSARVFYFEISVVITLVDPPFTVGREGLPYRLQKISRVLILIFEVMGRVLGVNTRCPCIEQIPEMPKVRRFDLFEFS